MTYINAALRRAVIERADNYYHDRAAAEARCRRGLEAIAND